ncbi:MAG: hypothetical protein HQ559_04135 [Lentisphaerae bacterium]|nr:hypothetical protein [Lentisphaerota bacterium]
MREEEDTDVTPRSSPGAETSGDQPDSVGAKLAESAAAALPMIPDPSARDLLRCLRSKDLLAESPAILERTYRRTKNKEFIDLLFLAAKANVARGKPRQALRTVRRAIRLLGGSRCPELDEFMRMERSLGFRQRSGRKRRRKAAITMTTSSNGNSTLDAEAESRYQMLVEEAIQLAKGTRHQFRYYWELGKLVAKAEEEIHDRSTLGKFVKALGQGSFVIKAACEMYRRFPDEGGIKWATEHNVTLGLMSSYLRGVWLRYIPQDVLRRLETTDASIGCRRGKREERDSGMLRHNACRHP